MILKKHESLFDGTLGVYPHKQFHIELEPDHTPVHARAYISSPARVFKIVPQRAEPPSKTGST